MAHAAHLEAASTAHNADASLFAGILKRMIWLAAISFAAALSLGPLFAPASALGSQGDQEIRVTLDEPMPQVAAETDERANAVRCRSAVDGRQEELLALAAARLGGSTQDEPFEYVSTRFWNEASGTAEVTVEFWYGPHSAARKLYLGRGTVDMDSCAVKLTSLV
ncbi:MAG: hypothetical protein CL955_02020 [Erythrobacteraceae bacterium]|nr:hypothetical protein [Erythrobacteraceae bacterium]